MISAPAIRGTVRVHNPLTHDDRVLRARVLAEFREMPGMRLTLLQAARLFDLEPARCAGVLDALVGDGTLWTNGREFLCANVGRRFA